MITAVYTIEKTGTAPWEYFTDPDTHLPDSCSIGDQFKVLMPYYYGNSAKTMFPDLKFTFEVVSPQKLLVHWESPDSATLVAWWDYYTSTDIRIDFDVPELVEKLGEFKSTNPGLYGLLHLIYPGEDISLQLEFTSVTEEFTKTDMYNFFKVNPFVNTPTMV